MKITILRLSGKLELDVDPYSITLAQLKEQIVDLYNKSFDEMFPPVNWTSWPVLAKIKIEAEKRGISKDKEQIKELVRQMKEAENEKRAKLLQEIQIDQIQLEYVDMILEGDDAILAKLFLPKQGIVMRLILSSLE